MTCRLCGATADLVRNEALDLWWCREAWGCLFLAAGLTRLPVQGGLW